MDTFSTPPTIDDVAVNATEPPPLRVSVKALATAPANVTCVLKVTAGESSVLLTGDIETISEQALSKRYGERLRADVLLASHHGSRTSSSPEFIAAVGAQTVIFPVGYRNRFRHPNAEVLRRHEATGAQLLRTDRDGAVTVRFGVSPKGTSFGASRGLTLQREARRRYWHGR